MSIDQAGARGWGRVAALAGLTGAGCGPYGPPGGFAARVEHYAPAPFTPPGAPWADPSRALGPPDGRSVAVGLGAHVVLRFFIPIEDRAGADLVTYALDPGGAEAKVAVSADGARFVEWPGRARGPSTEFDLADVGLNAAYFVRLRGLDRTGVEPGYDLDAVEALP